MVRAAVSGGASRTGCGAAANHFTQQTVIAMPKLSLEQGRMQKLCCRNAISMVPAAPAACKNAVWTGLPL